MRVGRRQCTKFSSRPPRQRLRPATSWAKHQHESFDTLTPKFCIRILSWTKGLFLLVVNEFKKKLYLTDLKIKLMSIQSNSTVHDSLSTKSRLFRHIIKNSSQWHLEQEKERGSYRGTWFATKWPQLALGGLSATLQQSLRNMSEIHLQWSPLFSSTFCPKNIGRAKLISGL